MPAIQSIMSKLSYVWPLILDLVLHASCKRQHKNNAMVLKNSKYGHGCTGCTGSYSLAYVAGLGFKTYFNYYAENS